MGNGEQIFKSNGYQWSQFNIAYSGEGMKQAPTKYMNVHGYLVDANKAIEEAGIEGVNKISENPNPDMVFRFATRRQKLEDFAHKVHVDVCTLIDDPFCERMAELSTSVRAHTEFKVNYNGQEYSIDVDDVSVESINRLFIDLIDPEYRDSQFVTGDKTVDNYIKEYSEFDPSNKKYGFEIALENWENLNPDQQEALRHLYEYYFRRVEENIDPDTAEAKGAQYILDKMTMHLDETPLNPNGAAKGLLSLMKKEHCHSYKMLEAIVDDKSFMIGAGMKINEKTTEEGFMNNWEEKTLSPTLCYEYDKAGIKLVRTFKDDKGWGIGIGSKEIAYYTSPQRCVDYVNYQEKKTPGCYNHMKELGYDEVMIASMLLASENTYDMQVFDNLTKSDGDYSKVFTVDARYLSDDAKKIIFSHTASMQSLYAALSEEKQNLGSSEQYRNTPEQYREKSFGALDKKIKLFKNELDGINSFYADSENSLASGYFDSYIEFSKQYMTQEQKVSLYSTPGYKLSDEELAEAKVLYKKELDSFRYHGKDQPIFKNSGDDIRYKNAVILKHKCSKDQSAFVGAEKAMADAGGAVLDLAVLDLSAKAYMATSVIDYVAGTDTKSYVSKFNEGYHELGDYFMAGINEDAQNVVTQNPEAYYVGNIGMKFLIYQAVSPVFESASKGLGVTSKAGKFFINQAGQDTLDTWLYTYPKYKELIADGELSTDDKIELGIDVGVNALLNLAFGGIEVAVDNKVTKDLVDEFRASDDINKFSKGLKDKDIKRLVESLEPDETEKLVKGLSGTNSSAKKVSREAQLYKEQGQIVEEAFDSSKSQVFSDAEGNQYKLLNRDEAKDLSDKLKQQIDTTPKGERGDYRVPETEKIRGVIVDTNGNVKIDEGWKYGTDGAKEGTRELKVLKATDENGNPIKLDRYGKGTGTYLSPLKDNKEPYNIIQRGTGDYLPEKNIADNDAYHLYEMKKDFSRENFEKAIKETYSDPDEIAVKLQKLDEYYNDAVDINSDFHYGDRYCDCAPKDADGVKTGEIDQMFLKEGDGYGKGTDGGGEQIIAPFSADELVEMGMIIEVN